MIRLILAVIALAAAMAAQASECNPLVDGQRCYTGRFDPADFTKARRDAAPQSPRRRFSRPKNNVPKECAPYGGCLGWIE
jgi:hypothetical protein